MLALKKALALALITAGASTAQATGGFICVAETYSGKKVSVGGCIPHGIAGLCSPLKVFIGDKLIEIPQDQVPNFYVGNLKDTRIIALTAYDHDFNEVVVDLVFQSSNKSDAIFSKTVSGTYARLELKVAGKTLKFNDVRCGLE
jgi:hypothetical protein